MITAIRSAISLTLLTILSQTTGITLANFSATYESGSILIEWETTSENDIYFFSLERSLQATSGYEVIIDYILAEGDSEHGSSYERVDEAISLGTTYYYRLVAVDFDEVETYYGPISVYAGSNPTPATPTPTASVTVMNPTRTPIQAQSITLTNTPESLTTSAPTQTPQTETNPTSTPASSPETMPTLEATPTGTPTELPSPTVILSTPVPDQTQASEGPIPINVLVRIALISVVIGIWAVLAIAGYFYIRKHFP